MKTNLPLIERGIEFEVFLKSKVKAYSSYLAYIRNAAKATEQPVRISDYSTEDALNDSLSFVKSRMSKDNFQNTCSALRQYHSFASMVEGSAEKSELIEWIEIDNKQVFVEVGEKHKIAFDFFKATGSAKQQELVVEYAFLKEIIVQAACQHKFISISRSDFDAYGFDLLLGMDDKVLMVQMKAYNGKAATWDVHQSLLKSENGRVVVANVQLVEGFLQVRYKMLRKDKVDSVLAKPAKNKKVGRCKVNKGDLIDITDNLLELFA